MGCATYLNKHFANTVPLWVLYFGGHSLADRNMTGARSHQEIEGRYQGIISDFDKIDQKLVEKVKDYF